MEKYYEEDLRTDIDWLSGFNIEESEAKEFIMNLLKSEYVTEKEYNRQVVKDVFNYLRNQLGIVIPIQDIVKEAEKKGVSPADTEQIVNNLIKIGDLYSHKKGLVQSIEGDLE